MALASTPLPALDAPSRLRKGDLPAVIVFAGEETFLAEEGIAAVLANLFPDGEPAGGLVTLDPAVPADAERIPSVLEELSTASLFGEGKVVIIRRAESIGGAADVDEEEGGEGEEDGAADGAGATKPSTRPAPVVVERIEKISARPNDTSSGLLTGESTGESTGKRAGKTSSKSAPKSTTKASGKAADQGAPAKPARRVNPITGLARQVMAAAVPGAHLIIATKKPVRGKNGISTEAIAKTGALLVDCRRLYDAPPPWAKGGSPYDTEVGAWLTRRSRSKHDKALEPKAAHALVRRVGASLAALARALETLVSYVGERPAVTEADVAATVGETREDPAWALADAILDRDLGTALRLVAQAFDHGLTGQTGRVAVNPDAIFPMLWAALHSSFRKAMLVCEAAARGANPTDLPGLAGMPSFAIERLLRQATRRPPDELLARHAAFVEADAGVKGGGVPPRLAMERLVVALAR